MSDGLSELRESARQVIGGAGLPVYEDKTWPLISELGWLLTAVPEELDGLGLGIQGASVLHSELGRGLSQAPFLPAMIAIDALCHSELADKANWIERFTTGDCVTAPLVEPELAFEHINTGKTTLTGLRPFLNSAKRASTSCSAACQR